MSALFQPGKLVSLRGRDWIVLPSDDKDLLIVKPLGGSDDEMTGIYLPLAIASDHPADANFPPPLPSDLGDIATARLLYESARLAFRNGAGSFRCLAKLSFRPRSYQMVPLIMALHQETVRLLIADDVGVGTVCHHQFADIIARLVTRWRSRQHQFPVTYAGKPSLPGTKSPFC
jgi:hypothetical protein